MSGLRILGGKAKGRVIKSLKSDDLSIRPMLGRMKKSLFDILQNRICGSCFLDLYAGTGAVGIEALSRGCERVVFVENSYKSLELIKENIEILGWPDKVTVHKSDVTKGLGWIKEKFDIIFMGPPYKDEQKRMLALTGITLKAVCEAGLLLPDGIIICQHHIKEQVNAPQELENYRSEKYGDTLLNFYRIGNVS